LKKRQTGRVGAVEAEFFNGLLASQLAYLLPFDAEQKIELLGLDEPASQLEQIQSLLEQLQDGA